MASFRHQMKSLCLVFLVSVIVFGCGGNATKPVGNTLPVAPPVLQLPYSHHKEYLITQAFNGTVSHQKSRSRYAVDFHMPIGTAVCAAQEGEVSRVSDGNRFSSFFKKANLVQIRHANGLETEYGHLKNGSIIVKNGDKVSTGQCFAKSGNTGYSTAPHLHFALIKNNQSIPFVFSTSKGMIKPKVGLWLKK